MHEIDMFLSGYPEEVQALAEKTRALIKKQIPEIGEQLDLPAKMLAYTFGKKYEDTICTIIFSKKGIKLGFYKGASLADPEKILEGTGKVHKYIPITEKKDFGPVQTILAFALDAYKKRKSN